MSGFRDTFTKDAKRDNLLDYDDSASLYFGGCILLCVLLPWTWYFISGLFIARKSLERRNLFPTKSKDGNTYQYCRCSTCEKTIQEKKAAASSFRQRVASFSFVVQLILLAALWLVFSRLAIALSNTTQIQAFDPFEILDLSSSASERDIKKAYRTLSLKNHPDKNPNDPSAAAKFILISKAYQTLTNDVAKENYKKFGNPDGPGLMKIGIGLPHFLVDEKYQLFILILFFSLLLVVIPAVFIIYYRKQQKYAPSGVMLETIHFLGYYLKETTRLKNCPEFLAASGESRELSIRPTDNEDMAKVMKSVVEHQKRKFNIPIITRNYFLILAHMQRCHDEMSSRLRADLDVILSKSPVIIQSMIEIAFLHSWVLTVQSVVEFRRCLVQALDVRSSSLLQIPHYDDESIKHCLRGKVVTKELKEFVKLASDERKGSAKMTPQERADVDAFCAHIPKLSVSVEARVDGEAEIVVGDIVSLTVKFTRLNLKEGEAAGPVHAPFFPDLKFEEWWIFVSEKATGVMCTFARCRSSERNVQEKLQFQVGRPGKCTYQVLLMCDSYAGLDIAEEVELKVCSEKEVKREIFVHPDDIALDNEPTLFQQMIGNIHEEDTSDEDEAEEGAGQQSAKSGADDVLKSEPVSSSDEE